MNILIETGWQTACADQANLDWRTICTQSHWQAPQQTGAPAKQVVAYRHAGVMVCVAPVIVQGRPVAALVTGAPLLAALDVQALKQQASRYGFGEQASLEELADLAYHQDAMPADEGVLGAITAFLVQVAEALFQTGYSRLRLAEEAGEHAGEVRFDPLMVLQSTMEATDNGILVVSEYGTVLHSNRRFAQMWCIPEEMLATGDEKIMLQYVSGQLVEPDTFLRAVEGLYANPGAEAFDILNFTDGRVFERASQPMLMDGRPAGRVWSFRDITGRKQAEQALRFSEERLSMALAVSGAGIWEWNLKSDLVHFDERFHALLGYQPGELPSDLQGWLTYHHPEDLPVMLSKAETYLRGDSPIYESEHRIRTRSGTWGWVFTRGQVVTLSGSGDEQFIGIAMNVTGRKQTEAELAQYRDHLEDLVASRTSALLASNQELEAFSYSVSHDLRAPLRSINGFSQIMLDEYGERLDETGKGYLHRIRGASRRMGELIDDLLKLSRIGRAELHVETVDLSAMVRSIADSLRQNQPDRRVEVVIQSDVIVRGDKFLLAIALENLLGNAWKFTARQLPARIEFGILYQDGQPVHFVRDNGEGFDMQYAEKLFAPFQRLHSESDYPGTGIGLSTVQRVIQRHGGRIWATAEMHRGATFYFTLV